MKVYVIGHVSTGKELAESIEAIRVAHNIPNDVEILTANSVEDIPIEDRVSSLVAVAESFKIKSLPRIELTEYKDPRTHDYHGNHRKGHQRPYKFHK